MSEREKKRGRVHNAQGARRAILDAAEELFSLHGFSGTRMEEIAAQAGYSKSLLFQYFDDKLTLYAEVLKRADQETNAIRAEVLTPVFIDESIATDPPRFRGFLETMMRVNFDYLVAHPRMMHILLWEMADGWQTYAKISAQFSQEELEPFQRICRKAIASGLLNSNFTPIIQFTIAQPIGMIYLAYLPVYQISMHGEDLTTPAALARAREFLVNLLLSGIFKEPVDGSATHGETNAN